MAETVEPKKISALTIIATLVLLGAFSGFTWLVYLQRQTIPTAEEQKREERLKTLAALNSDNQKVLTVYHWIDKSKGIVGIPINRAMQLVVNDLAANHPHPAGPINPPAPSPSPSPAANQPSASPAPSPVARPAPSPGSSPAPAVSPAPAASPAGSPAPVASPAPAASPASSPAPVVNPVPATSPAGSAAPASTPSPGSESSPSPAASPTGVQTRLNSPQGRKENSPRLEPISAPARSRSFSLVPARSASHCSPPTSHLLPYVCS